MDFLIIVRDWAYAILFILFFLAVAWFIFRRSQPRRANEIRVEARSWLGRAWDSVVRFWSR